MRLARELNTINVKEIMDSGRDLTPLEDAISDVERQINRVSERLATVCVSIQQTAEQMLSRLESDGGAASLWGFGNHFQEALKNEAVLEALREERTMLLKGLEKERR